VGKALAEYKSECRHGSAYTVISSEYAAVKTETTFFVPLGKNYECWHLKVTNVDRKPRRLSVFTYVEYASNWNALDDLINLQYTQFIVKMESMKNLIDHGTNVNIPLMPHNFQEKDQGRHTFLALVGADMTGFDTDRATFIGPYRTYANPIVVEEGRCSNSLAAGDNACGTFQIDLALEPGESKELLVLMGIGEAQKEGKQAAAEFREMARVREELGKLKAYWHRRIKGLVAATPDPEFNSMMNMWGTFNCLITYAWSRAASLIYAGERDGLGYRDTVQDMLGVMHTIPEEARERLELMITGQVSIGGAMPIVKQFAHQPGREKLPLEEEYRSDDCLWLFNAIPAYVKETGNLVFYKKVLPYGDAGEDTVLGHMKRAILFNLDRSGAHHLPCGLSADWNDCIRLGHQGESVFVAFQLRYALRVYLEACQILNQQEEIAWAVQKLKVLDEALETYAWDGEWYLRAYRYDGFKFGSRESEEGQIFLSPQSWSIISGHASPKRARQAMQSVEDRLATDYGLMICDPPYAKTDFQVMRATLMNSGMKENGSIFTHIQGWAVMAAAILGNGEQAYRYFKAYMPAAYNTRAEIRQIEPYVYCQFTHSKYSPRYGASRIPWLSGSASWSFFAATQYILGIQPEYFGLRVNPCIPASWNDFKVSRIYRGKTFNIEVKNPAGVQKGVKQLILNGEALADNFIPVKKMKDINQVMVEMG
jgi:cellobiose phosphorylase